jgi:hypothetical protein
LSEQRAVIQSQPSGLFGKIDIEGSAREDGRSDQGE